MLPNGSGGTTIINTPNPPARCPSCDNLENKKVICGHCNYEYKEESEFSFWECILAIIFLLFFVWLVVTITFWFTYSDQMSLTDVLKDEWEFIKNIPSNIISFFKTLKIK